MNQSNSTSTTNLVKINANKKPNIPNKSNNNYSTNISNNSNSISKTSTFFSHSTPSVKSKKNKARSYSQKCKSNIVPIQLVKVEEKLNEYLKLIDMKMKEVSKSKRNCHTYRAKSACSISSFQSKEKIHIDNSFVGSSNKEQIQLSQIIKDKVPKKNSSRKSSKNKSAFKTIPLKKTNLKNMSIYLKNNRSKKDIPIDTNKSDIFHIKNLLLNNSSVNNNMNVNVNINEHNASLSLCGSNNILKCIMDSGNTTSNTNSNHKCATKMNLRQIIFNKCVVNNQS